MASTQDAEQIAEIYKPYVIDTAVSFENTAPDSREISQRIQETLSKFPWLVCEIQNQIIGYAYAGAYRSRCAYGWSVETTVYVRQGHQNKGIGRQLYRQLLSILKEQGVVNVLGGIDLPNEASVGLHESLGFVKVAQFKDVGFKLGKWWDVGYWQLQLQKPKVPASLSAPKF